METTMCFCYFSSQKHPHNKVFIGLCWTDFHLALCVRDPHLVLVVGAEGRKPSCPNDGDSLPLWHMLLFTDLIHVQIILGPIVHLLRTRICARVVLNLTAGLKKKTFYAVTAMIVSDLTYVCVWSKGEH